MDSTLRRAALAVAIVTGAVVSVAVAWFLVASIAASQCHMVTHTDKAGFQTVASTCG